MSQQGKLDAALKKAIDAADSKARLEDLSRIAARCSSNSRR
jgi:transcriptional accessory protein Tex/SPT6